MIRGGVEEHARRVGATVHATSNACPTGAVGPHQRREPGESGVDLLEPRDTEVAKESTPDPTARAVAEARAKGTAEVSGDGRAARAAKGGAEVGIQGAVVNGAHRDRSWRSTAKSRP